jgi:two-component system chemotaxis response regulator CheB
MTRRRVLQPGERIRVLVIDDSAVIRRLITNALDQDAEIEVVGTASNGLLGLQRIPQLDPDVLTLDIEMPDMDGLEMLRCVRRDHPHLRVIMFSTLTERGAAITLDALRLGADDYVTKVSNQRSLDQSILRLRSELIPKIKQFFQICRQSTESLSPAITAGLMLPHVNPGRIGWILPRVIAIGISTGGPAALASILPALPADFPIPILIVQHMPPLFTKLLADRLDEKCALRISEARQGSALEAGSVLLAPGDFHMSVVSKSGQLSVCLDQAAQQNYCRPAVDVLFRSVAEVYGGAAVGVVLTGMGHDGLRGATVMKARGAMVIAQDEPSSVVWGMPGAVVNAGLADRILSLNAVVPEILRICHQN